MTIDNLPAQLRETGLFCCWRYEERNGKRTKVPYNPRTGGKAQSTNPQTFAPLPAALAALEPSRYDGIGVGVFGTLGAIDIDHCISDTGEISNMALDIAHTMRAYTEKSPSGHGLRILFTVLGSFQYDKARFKINNQGIGLEVYIAPHTNKYVTVTGDALTPGLNLEERTEQLRAVLEKYMVRPRAQKPTPPAAPGPLDWDSPIGDGTPAELDDLSLIERAKRSRKGAQFAALWAGDTTGYKSASEADIALCNALAFWTGKDAARMDRLFRQSGLFRPEKWDRPQSGSTYGAITIQNAIDSTRQVYDPAAYHQQSAAKDFAPLVGGSAGSAGFAGRPNGEKGFCEFCYFCGPDVSKNPIFPAEEFSGELLNFSVWSGESLQVSVDMPAVSALAAVSLCAQRKFKVHPHARHYEPVNLYTAIVAKPSERKSATIALTMEPIYKFQREENERRRSRVEEYRDKKDMLLRRIESLKKLATSGKKAKGAPPATAEDIKLLRLELEDLEKAAIDYISLTADDITMEALTSKMAANGEKMALISSEGGIFNVMSGLYTGGTVNIDLILKAWSGDHVEVDRKGRPPEILLSPALTINLMVQPKVLEAVMNNVEFAGRGLNARFLYSLPISIVGARVFDAPDIPQQVIDDYYGLLNRILAIPDTGEPRIIECTDEARNELRKIHDEIEPRLIADLEPMGDWAGKYEGAVIRIAGLLHVCDHVERAAEIPIPGETIRRASKIGEYFLAHAKTAYQLAGQMDDQPTKDAKYILKRLDSTGKTEISKRDLFDLCKGRVGFESAEKMEPGLEVLVKRGYIKIERVTKSQNSQKSQNRGRPSWMIYVNPICTKMKEEGKL